MDLTGHLLYYQEGKHKINLDNYVQQKQLKETSDTINNSVTEALKSKVDSATKITYTDLKNLRDNSQLIPGSLYRITDYNCTTTQENTRSAGHQFDIVLLALSENKLAEEGWAMMNESNVYDVTFSDAVTLKCWIYPNSDDEGYDIAVVGEELTKGLGALVIGDSFDDADLILNQEDKSAMCNQSSSDLLDVENISYNYFQNSNLSAWKVWYSLDNDTDRFAWADDSISEPTPTTITTIYTIPGPSAVQTTETYIRNSSIDIVKDGIQYYGFSTYYTKSQNPSVGDTIYERQGPPNAWYMGVRSTVESVIPATESSPNGRGVIYRLIDEWNNDVAYDFKNIQYARLLTDGVYDPRGYYTWCYTTGETALDIDLSIWHYPTHDLYISSVVDFDLEDDTSKYFLPNNVFLGPASSKLYDTTGCTMMGAPLEMRNCRNVVLGEGVSAGVYINCFEMSDNNDEKSSFYFNNAEVVTAALDSGGK